MKTQQSVEYGEPHRDARDPALNLVRIQEIVTQLVGDEHVSPENVSFFGRGRQTRLLGQVVDLIRPALPLLVFRPPVELSIEDPASSDAGAPQHTDWSLKCLVLGPKFLTGDTSVGADSGQSSFSADLVLCEDGDLYALDWTGTWIRTPQGGITYRATVRHYKTYEDALDDGWGPVEHYIQQIEYRLEAALREHRRQ